MHHPPLCHPEFARDAKWGFALPSNVVADGWIEEPWPSVKIFAIEDA
jgi:hypothetical protein